MRIALPAGSNHHQEGNVRKELGALSIDRCYLMDNVVTAFLITDSCRAANAEIHALNMREFCQMVYVRSVAATSDYQMTEELAFKTSVEEMIFSIWMEGARPALEQLSLMLQRLPVSPFSVKIMNTLTRERLSVPLAGTTRDMEPSLLHIVTARIHQL